MSNEEKILNLLMDMQKDIKELKEGQTKVDNRMNTLEGKMTALENKVNTICDDVKFIKHKEFQNEQELFHLKNKLDNITDRLNAVEAVTKENLYDIAKLKLIK